MSQADTPEGPSPYVDYEGIFRAEGGTNTALAHPDGLLLDSTTHFIDTMAGVFTYSRDSQGGIQVTLGAEARQAVDVDPNSRPVAYRGGVVWQATDDRALIIAADGSQSYRKVSAGWKIVGATLDHLWAQAVYGFSQVNFSSLKADAVVLTNGTCSTVLAGKSRTQVGPQICGRVLVLDLLDDHMSAAVTPPTNQQSCKSSTFAKARSDRPSASPTERPSGHPPTLDSTVTEHSPYASSCCPTACRSSPLRPSTPTATPGAAPDGATPLAHPLTLVTINVISDLLFES